MYNLVKYKEIETLYDITDEGQFMIINFVKSFCQRYHIGPKIDIISRCKPFSNPKYPNYIKLCQGYFDVELHLPMSKLTVHILNYLE